MNFQPERKEDVELNITPLIDVVFLLLIFFMITTTFERESELSITLPEASREVSEAKPDAIRVSVDARSRVYVNDQALLNTRTTTIKEAIDKVLGDLRDVPVIISADAEATHQIVVNVMDAARQLGLVKITFATRTVEEES